MKLNYFAAILLMSAGLAQGETIDVLGQKISFSNPSGYCTLGHSQRERDLMTMSQRSVGPGSRIVHAPFGAPNWRHSGVGLEKTLITGYRSS